MDEARIEKEKQRLGAFPCPETPPAPIHGVLLSDKIDEYANAPSIRLIHPFESKNLKPAGYKLTVGDEFIVNGEVQKLPANGIIRIAPYSVVIIKTAETINLPRFLIARWNILVKWAYKGLLWVGAAQVDPGWVGQLPCPIYNLSDKDVVLRPGDDIALMDFVVTTPFRKGESKEYHRPPELVLLEQYNVQPLKSGVASELDASKDKLEKSANRVDAFVGLTFVVLGILVAAVALRAPESQNFAWWDPSAFWISALAIIVSLFAWTNSRSSVQWFRRTWQRIVFELIIFVLMIIAIFRFSIRTQSGLRDLNDRMQKIENRVNPPAHAPVPPTHNPS
jgi:deoxycytidine triphosphate deaminase